MLRVMRRKLDVGNWIFGRMLLAKINRQSEACPYPPGSAYCHVMYKSILPNNFL